MLVLDAYRHLGADASAAKMHDYLESLGNWAGINGFYDFRNGSQRGLGQSSMIVLQWIKPNAISCPLALPVAGGCKTSRAVIVAGASSGVWDL